ncbi:MAG: hypothetical protein U0401_24250 [Anaerolineae bacterium]
MISLLILLACGLGALVLIVAVVAVIVLMQTGERDVVSTARQGWINRRSEQDKEGW